MISGNGRHRRPRQAPALLVAAGVTGSAIAIPLLGAASANAADGTTWDKVAECETGGSWSADHGNGYYGGLQLSQNDWEKYGGLDFAPSADQASRSQQIAVAEKMLDDQGPGAWPTCGLLSGLTKKSGAANVDTGVGKDSSSRPGNSGSSSSSHLSGWSSSSGNSDDEADDPGLSDSSQGSDDASGSSDSSGTSGSSGSSAGASGSSDSPSGLSGLLPGPSGSDDPSGESSTEPSTSPSSPARTDNPAKTDTSHGYGHSGASRSVTDGPDGYGNSGDSDNSGQSVGSSALVDTGALGTGRHRGGSASDGPAESRTDAAGGRHAYTVRSGDSLTSIADSLDLHGGWHALYDANKATIGTDPDQIAAGQSLDVPAENAQK
jgi:hypothetical protein